MHHVDVLSSLEPAHLEQLPRLLEAAAVCDGHEPVGEHKFLRIQRGDDLALALLAYEQEALAGYAHTLTYGEGEDRRLSCEFVVHPEQRRRGIGRLLLAHVMDEARTRAARRIDVWAYNDSAASTHMAGEFGFVASRRLLHLHRHVSGPQVALDAPAGVSIRGFRPGADDVRWLELNNRIFRGHPENGAWTIDDFRSRSEQGWFDPADLLMLEVNSVAAGFCWLKVEDRDEGRVGEIYVIGTAPECRGMGLGRYLLNAALAHLAARGVSLAAIYVDESNVAAVALYESAGFHYHHVDVCYSAPVAPAVRDGERASSVAA